jgi:hypothetical protein
MLYRVRMSEFWQLVDGEFGAGYGRTLVRDHVLGELGQRTAAQALEAGERPRTVWLALCRELRVPPQHWWGRDPAAKPSRGGRGVSGASNTRSD